MPADSGALASSNFASLSTSTQRRLTAIGDANTVTTAAQGAIKGLVINSGINLTSGVYQNLRVRGKEGSISETFTIGARSQVQNSNFATTDGAVDNIQVLGRVKGLVVQADNNDLFTNSSGQTFRADQIAGQEAQNGFRGLSVDITTIS
ncbi:hypothetical protein [Vulcanococcus limneticus]|uniref:hypothetical protein n=1 Tax=Vulcanococcus limneticus TaxID=2170428 RepID=UPI00398C1221